MNNQILLKDGSYIARLGQGTWKMGEDRQQQQKEMDAIKYGIRHDLRLIDTAEMYGDGKTEALIGEAIKGIDREQLYIISKVYPHNASREKIENSLKQSMYRLGVDYLDMYLLHWRGQIPLAETVGCMERLVKEGLIKRWGVSNFDTSDIEELLTIKEGKNCVVNQVLYHLGSRGVEYSLLPLMKTHNIKLMAYCPIAQGGSLRGELLRNTVVQEIALKYNITTIQVLLSFVLHQEDMIVIPKASDKRHVQENIAVHGVVLDPIDVKRLSDAFPAPNKKAYLDIV